MSGISGRKYRLFINNLIEAIPDPRYLEVGVWQVDPMRGHLWQSRSREPAIDNWSLFGEPSTTFFRNLERFKGPDAAVDFLEADFRDVDFAALGTFNVYFFDGPHTAQDQYDGLVSALPALEEQFVLIVDDWNWAQVREGTSSAIRDAHLSIDFQIDVRTTMDDTHPNVSGPDSSWHNGYLIAVVSNNFGSASSMRRNPKQQGSELRDITLSFVLTNDRYVDDFLRSIHNQSYSKEHLHLFVDCFHLGALGKESFREFVAQYGGEYKRIVVVDDLLPDIKRQAVRYCATNSADYFSIDENVVLHPKTLRRLHDHNLEVVAPMLVFDGEFSNFHAYVDEHGYFRDGDDYGRIVRRELRGVVNVPVVNTCYLVRNDCLKYVNYDDASGRMAYVVFSDILRANGIPQYIDNTFNYGIMIDYANKSDREIERLDAASNKQFYLTVNDKNKRGIICDADWLSSYVIDEHFYLMRLLQDRYCFHIINCGRLSVQGLDFVEDLNAYDVLLTGYHVSSKVPLDRVTARKIYKIDDMENDPDYTRLVNFYIANSDVVISPYAYVFDKYYKHDKVVWVPYSCALEFY